MHGGKFSVKNKVGRDFKGDGQVVIGNAKGGDW